MILKSLFRKSNTPREKEIIALLKKNFSVRVVDVMLYKQALCHKSAARNIHGRPEMSNERLEFLGDAVIDVAVADFLYQNNPKAEEGVMTQMKSRIVSRDNLNHTAIQVGLHKLLETDLQADNSRESICGNAFEAIIGAIYLDHGYMKARKSTLKVLEKFSDMKELQKKESDFKSRLYEEAHKLNSELSFQTKPIPAGKGSHQFESIARLNGNAVGKGKGSSKKKAEQQAAQAAFEKIREDEGKIS